MAAFISDITADVKDIIRSFAKPFADIRQDILDAKNVYSKKHLNNSIVRSILRRYPASPSLINFLQRGVHSLAYHSARLEALHQTPHVSRELLMKELLPKTAGNAPLFSFIPAIATNPLAVGAAVIGAAAGIFAACKTCRLKTNRFCKTLFRITSAIGRQTRSDIALIARSTAHIATIGASANNRRSKHRFTYIPFEETIALFSNIFFKWIPAFAGMTGDRTLKSISQFCSNGNNSAHFPKHHHGQKTPFWRKNYALEFVILAIVLGSIGVFMSIYADTSSNRANMPIVYQGRLMDASYIPKSDGDYYIAFEIYSASSGGTCKWRTETTQDGSCGGSDLTALTATTSRGLFTVVLGAGTSNNPTFGFNFDTSTSYLQVYVCPNATPGTTGSCETLSPRKQLGGVTYAYNADLLDGINYDGFLQLAPGTSAQTLTFTGTTTNVLSISATSLSSGKALVVTGPSGATAGVTNPIIDITSDMGHLGGSSGLVKIASTIDTTTSPNISTSLYISTTNSNTTNPDTAYGIYNYLTDSVALPNSNYGMYIDMMNTGAHTSSTKYVYGEYISAISNGSNGGDTNAYGLYITGKTIQGVNDSSTANYYGLYVANDGNGNQGYGISTKYGLYVDSQSGADTNYAAIFAGGNVGIGATAPNAPLEVYGNSASVVLELLKLTNANINAGDTQLTFAPAGDSIAAIRGIIYDSTDTGKGNLAFATANGSGLVEAMRIDRSGKIGIGTMAPSSIVSVTPTQYNTGTASQSTTTVTGVGTTFTSAMVGSQFVFANGVSAGTITAFTDATHLTVSASQTVAEQAYKIAYTGLQVNSDGQVLIGSTSAQTIVSTIPYFQIEGIDGAIANASIIRNSANTAPPIFNLVKTRSGSNNGNTVVASGDETGKILFVGADGTDKNSVTARISSFVDGTPGTGDMPGRLVFYTTADAASSATERLRIDSAGNVGIGTSAPTAILQVTQPTTGIGTVSITMSEYTITGSGTQFTNTFKVGDTITINSTGKIISAITSDTQMTISTPWSDATVSNVSYTLTGGTRFSVSGSGNIGIGTTTPQALAHLYAASSVGILRIASTTEANDDMAGITFGGGTSATSRQKAAITFLHGGTGSGANGKGDLLFLVDNVGDDNEVAVGDEKMRITQAGNVGIGTATPYSTLQVNGYVQIQHTASTSAPASGDCDVSTEVGRMTIWTDTTSSPHTSYLYTCVQTTSVPAYGWKRVTVQ